MKRGKGWWIRLKILGGGWEVVGETISLALLTIITITLILLTII